MHGILDRSLSTLSLAENQLSEAISRNKLAPTKDILIRNELAELYSNRPEGNIVVKLFGRKDNPIVQEDNKWFDRIKKLESELANLTIHEDVIMYYRKRIVEKENWIANLRSEITRKEAQKQKHDEIVALAVQNMDQSRVLANSIKINLQKQKECPYCGMLLTDSVHVDHIYPIAKGGKSTSKNMVWVCDKCNLRKGTLTLTGFIRKYHLDRVEIERKLDMLGKEY